jgi:hypothetical protein
MRLAYLTVVNTFAALGLLLASDREKDTGAGSGLLSGKEFRERKGAMATWWDQIVLPVGRMQD